MTFPTSARSKRNKEIRALSIFRMIAQALGSLFKSASPELDLAGPDCLGTIERLAALQRMRDEIDSMSADELRKRFGGK